jgi:hypothetical protein
VSEPLDRYNRRIRELDIRSCDVTNLKRNPGGDNLKFYPDGEAKTFHGLTCIAWVDRESGLFRKLCELQDRIRKELEKAGLNHLFAFLAPESLHMTICDIEAGPNPVRVNKLGDRVTQIQRAFSSWREIPRSVTAQIRGLGLGRTITALVRFDGELGSELEAVLRIEGRIKSAAQVDIRDFTGHISLAYLVQHPGDHIGEIRRVLLDCAEYGSHAFTFSRFDLTYFTDMHEYIPIMTIDLENRDLRAHDNNIQMIKTVTLLLRAVTRLCREPASSKRE